MGVGLRHRKDLDQLPLVSRPAEPIPASVAPPLEADEPVTVLLRQWADGDSGAGEQLFALVYGQLHSVAKAQRRRWSGDDTLDTTALVHEVYLRMSGATGLDVRDRAHFYAIAARATRQILSNYARRRRTQKRGTAATAVSLDKLDVLGIPRVDGGASPLDRLWDLEVALQALQNIHPRPCRVVECRYFGGLSIPDTATALAISEATVKRDWMLAQAWLHRALKEHAPGDD